MSYRIEVDQRAAKELFALPKEVVQRLHASIGALANNARPPGSRKLTGRDGHRVRAGDYRVLYTVDDTAGLIRIFRVGHRKGVYR